MLCKQFLGIRNLRERDKEISSPFIDWELYRYTESYILFETHIVLPENKRLYIGHSVPPSEGFSCRGNGSREGKAVAAQIQENLDPIVTIDEIDGEEFTAHPLDSCDAGQLEACAIERFTPLLYIQISDLQTPGRQCLT